MIKNFNKLSLFILLFLIITVFYPLLIMLMEVEWNNFSSLISSSAFQESLSNSLIVTSISTIISISLGFILAYLINRTNIKRKKVL